MAEQTPTGRAATLAVALIAETFFDETGEDRLREALREAKSHGAELALLPELPLNRWAPATRQARDEDAEAPKGRRHQIQAAAAEAAGIGLIGGAIVKDPRSGRRHNTALLFDHSGAHLGSYRKCHIPNEPGFHETAHYLPGDEPAAVFDAFALRFGIQICSDINRPAGPLALAAGGAEAIMHPRASERTTVHRWRLVFQALALTSGAYVLSVNRPRPEADADLGGPSIVADPFGEIIAESNVLGDDIVVALCTPEKQIASSGQRYIKARRTELYDKLLEPAGEAPITQPGWDVTR